MDYDDSKFRINVNKCIPFTCHCEPKGRGNLVGLLHFVRNDNLLLGIDHERTRRFGVCRNESDTNKWRRFKIERAY
jgi:hypothetical protein